MCNSFNEPLCSGFGYRPHQAGAECPTPPTPTDSMFQQISAEAQADARVFWLKDILKEQQELAIRRMEEYGL